MNWSVLIGSATILVSVITYLLSRRSELAWKRTEFLCSQAQYFDNDEVLIEVSAILEERHPEVTVAKVFGARSEFDPGKQLLYKQKFDKMFNFLWRLCYAYLQVGTLTRKEVEGFRWYFRKISESDVMVEYCEKNGYEDINTVTRALKLDRVDYRNPRGLLRTIV
jgi:hypothetical protein